MVRHLMCSNKSKKQNPNVWVRDQGATSAFNLGNGHLGPEQELELARNDVPGQLSGAVNESVPQLIGQTGK
jgi:hypothetical protein